MIEVAGVSKSFGDMHVLSDITFTVSKGETVSLKGRSGIGKSTLLRLIAGIDTDYSGTITRPKNIAMVFQEPNLLPWRTAFENITLMHRDLEKNAAIRALERVGIADKSTAFPGQMSLGQQRRLSLARAFAGAPDMLVLDEPFVSLDPEIADEMFQLTETLIRETQPATIFVTHVEAEAKRLADRVLILAGAPATLTQNL